MNLKKTTLAASTCSAIAGLTIFILTIMLANLIERTEVKEIESKREIITQLIRETMDLNARNFDTVTNSVMGLYMASEYVTEEEFAKFAGYMVENSPSIANIIVFQDGTAVRSYPMGEFLGRNRQMFEDTLTQDNIRYVILASQERSGIAIALFVDPSKIVPMHTVLKGEFKAVLYVDGERFFGASNNKFGYNHLDAILTSDELSKSLEVNTSLKFEQDRATEMSFDYLIWQSDFEGQSGWIWMLTVLGGLCVGILVASLLFMEIKTRYEIRGKNRQLKINAELLKKTEYLLLESEEKFRNLFELSPVPVSVLDLDGNVVSYNSMAAQVFGYGRNEGIGHHFLEFISESDGDLSMNLFNTVISTGQVTNANIKCKKKDGQTFSAKISANTMTNKDAQISGVIVVIVPLR